MTAGNFKRQAPICLPELPAVPHTGHDAGDLVIFTAEIGDDLRAVHRDNPESWEHLTGITGIGVAMATTLLSALWPGYHVIADQRDIGAAIGLAYDEAFSEGLLKSAGYKGEVVSWRRYRWFRPKVIGRAEAIGVEAVAVERALFQIDMATGANSKTPWEEYRRELATLAGHASPVRAVAYSPDGRWIAVGSNDSTLKVWDIAKQECLATLLCLGPVESCDYGIRICCGDASGTVYILDLMGSDVRPVRPPEKRDESSEPRHLRRPGWLQRKGSADRFGGFSAR